MLTLTRAAVAATLTFMLCACGGGSAGGPIFNPNPIGYAQCNPGASVVTTAPQSGSYNVPTNIGTIEIALSNNANPVWSNPSAWTLALQSSFTSQIVPLGGNLNVTSDPNGPHPFPNDFYLNQGVGQLQAGTQYNVYLEPVNASCNPVQVGQFST
jgi:hypothetical protein